MERMIVKAAGEDFQWELKAKTSHTQKERGAEKR